MEASHHRHDIDDRAWGIISPLLPGQRGQWGGIAEDNRRFVNAVLWMMRTGAPWRDLPPDYVLADMCFTRFALRNSQSLLFGCHAVSFSGFTREARRLAAGSDPTAPASRCAAPRRP